MKKFNFGVVKTFMNKQILVDSMAEQAKIELNNNVLLRFQLPRRHYMTEFLWQQFENSTPVKIQIEDEETYSWFRIVSVTTYHNRTLFEVSQDA